MDHKDLWIDLSDIELQDLEVLTQEGAKGIPEFAASTACNENCYSGSSTSMEEPSKGKK